MSVIGTEKEKKEAGFKCEADGRLVRRQESRSRSWKVNHLRNPQ